MKQTIVKAWRSSHLSITEAKNRVTRATIHAKVEAILLDKVKKFECLWKPLSFSWLWWNITISLNPLCIYAARDPWTKILSPTSPLGPILTSFVSPYPLSSSTPCFCLHPPAFQPAFLSLPPASPSIYLLFFRSLSPSQLRTKQAARPYDNMNRMIAEPNGTQTSFYSFFLK